METAINQDFQIIRDRLQLPRAFPLSVLKAAQTLAQNPPAFDGLLDLQAVPFITIDPPTSLDLDQAFWAKRLADGYHVRYAIADVSFWVAKGSVLEREAWRRGNTYYSPDIKTPLYPPALSEGLASLLPNKPRPAIVFDFKLDERAAVLTTDIKRALVQSRAKLAYAQVGAHLDAERQIAGSGSLVGQAWSDSLALLEEIGRKRQQLESERGGISLRIPAQQVERWTTALYGYRLAFEEATPVEEWNAQVSLMTGMAAAQMMIKHSAGLLRALDAPQPERVHSLRLAARALGVAWPAGVRYDEFVRSLDPHVPLHSVLLHQAARVNGGARYVMFEGAMPDYARHAAIAAPYAHVTAPLRRLADRYALDLLVTFANGKQPAHALLEVLDHLPATMTEAETRSRKLESAIVDFAEARLMQDRPGAQFDALVIGLRPDAVIVQIADPPIRTKLPLTVFGHTTAQLAQDGATLQIEQQEITLGQQLRLRLMHADAEQPRLDFALVG